MELQFTILRGLPGSGKSWFANALKTKGHCEVCSADDYTTVENGVPTYTPAALANAYGQCLQKCAKLLTEGYPYRIVVDNTNLHAWEIAPYYALAVAFCRDPRIVQINCDPVIAFKRQMHYVPSGKFLYMLETLNREILPAHWKREWHVLEY
jgi:predicted kinase